MKNYSFILKETVRIFFYLKKELFDPSKNKKQNIDEIYNVALKQFKNLVDKYKLLQELEGENRTCFNKLDNYDMIKDIVIKTCLNCKNQIDVSTQKVPIFCFRLNEYRVNVFSIKV